MEYTIAIVVAGIAFVALAMAAFLMMREKEGWGWLIFVVIFCVWGLATKSFP